MKKKNLLYIFLFTLCMFAFKSNVSALITGEPVKFQNVTGTKSFYDTDEVNIDNMDYEVRYMKISTNNTKSSKYKVSLSHRINVTLSTGTDVFTTQALEGKKTIYFLPQAMSCSDMSDYNVCVRIADTKPNAGYYYISDYACLTGIKLEKSGILGGMNISGQYVSYYQANGATS